MATFDLVLEGGGIKGSAFVGAIEVLRGKMRGKNYDLGRLIGCSAGAITAACLAAGLDDAELLEMAQQRPDGKLSFRSFLGQPKSADFSDATIGAVVRLLAGSVAYSIDPPDLGFLKSHGLLKDKDIEAIRERWPKFDKSRVSDYVYTLCFLLDEGAAFSDANILNWLTDTLKKKVKSLDEKTTLSAFHNQTNCHLSLVATDITDHEVLVLNHITAPKCPVVWAVRMSMGIPFVWREVTWNQAWGDYLDKDIKDHLIVDGGILCNFPLQYFLQDKDETHAKLMGPPPDNKSRVLGLLLDETKVAPGTDAMAQEKLLLEELRAYQTLSRLISTLTGNWSRDLIKKYKADAAVCRIGVKGFNALDFNMEPSRLELLIQSGRCAMTEHLAKHALFSGVLH
jgi:predicted acylesterase/phospholipase RssA